MLLAILVPHTSSAVAGRPAVCADHLKSHSKPHCESAHRPNRAQVATEHPSTTSFAEPLARGDIQREISTLVDIIESKADQAIREAGRRSHA